VRCHYLSDLHLESQDFPFTLPTGDVLIVAGDLCHASCLDPARTDLYAERLRERVARFADEARARFAHVLLVAGNHDHYDGFFDDTVSTLRRHLPGFTVLDDSHIDIAGVRFFGTTLWSDFDGRDQATMDRLRRGVGEFFFVRLRDGTSHELRKAPKFKPEDALAAHDRALASLRACLADAGGTPTIVVSHHAPSRLGLNPRHVGNGLDAAYASDLDGMIESLTAVPVWVHGHTHVRKRYRIGATQVLANCRGFVGRDPIARQFKPDTWFEP
jgi:Icc-related predicted phosphoesterase